MLALSQIQEPLGEQPAVVTLLATTLDPVKEVTFSVDHYMEILHIHIKIIENWDK